MKRANEKITDAIRSGKRPRKRGARLINLNMPPYTSYEEAVELGRRRIEGFGYAVDPFGHVITTDTYYNQ
jgi:hypothetical protein